MSITIDERIMALEQEVPGMAGTQLTRTMFDKGLGWTLALGRLAEPKRFFYGSTIEEVLALAEHALKGEACSRTSRKRSRSSSRR